MSQSTVDPSPPKLLGKPDALARRTRLREFQAQLLERMQAARTGTAPATSQLGVVIGQQRWLLDLKEAGEIVSVGTIAQVPLTQPWFLGLTNIRGNLVSVIDFSRFQGFAPLQIEKETRIVAFSSALAVNSGLLVSRVMGLRNVQEMTEQESGHDESPWAVRAYLDKDGEKWMQLSLPLIIQEPRFLQIGL